MQHLQVCLYQLTNKGDFVTMDTETNKEIRLTEQHIKAIEKCLNGRDTAEIILKLENGKTIVLLQSHKKRII